MRILFILALFLSSLHGAEVRVATFNVHLGIGDEANTTFDDYDAIVDVLARIDADVVALQEVKNGELNSLLPQLASSLGYSHIFSPTGIELDTSNSVVLISKYPFLSTHSIASPSGAKDVARAHAAAVVDVPGTHIDPMIITLHLKCCFEADDFFRRAVELERVKHFLDDKGLDGSDNIIVLGDFNLLGSAQTFSQQDFQNLTTLPTTYSLGSDISFPVQYYTNPASYFTAYPLLNPMPLQQNGTTPTTFHSGGILDYILISQALLDRGPVLEVYNSAREASFPGLPKSGNALASGTSREASDHFPIFGDFALDTGLPLQITLNTNTLTEGGTPAQLNVTLPDTPTQPITVLLCSSDPSEIMPVDITLTFPAGVTSQSTNLNPKTDKIIDGTQSVTLMATAAGYLPATETFSVLNTDTSQYVLSAIGVPVTEDFVGFAGTQTPAKWSASGLTWLGLDDGVSSANGFRSYGNEGSIGVQTPQEVSFSGSFKNSTGEILQRLQVTYDAEQWHSSFEGSQDRWEVDVVTAAGKTSIPALTFISNTTLTSGRITDGTSSTLTVIIGGLNIAIGEDFQILFTAIPSMPKIGDADAVFLNEIHYDNTSSDVGEFLEIMVGPDYSGAISEIQVSLYNGAGGSSYATHDLNTFTLDSTEPSGHRIYSKDISGIQNGGSDGIAITENGNVLQFLSYEGTMTAMSGPASGATSIDIGVAQSPVQAAGQGSLGLTGNGLGPENFTWTQFASPFTKGALNEDQTLASAIKSQGLAFDNLEVTALLPAPDSQIIISSDLMLSFPTESGVNYEIEISTDLQNWSLFEIINGTGSSVMVDVSSPDQDRFFRVLSQ